METQKIENRNRARGFLFSLLLALISIALLNITSSCKKESPEMPETKVGVFPCNTPFEISEGTKCSGLYMPVCGCDGITYKNACEALYGIGVSSWTTGACEINNACKGTVDHTVVCDSVFEPVCGCDGNTYINRCEAKRNGIEDVYQGVCGTIEILACFGQSTRIGVQKNPDNYYQWEPNSNISCLNCAENTVAVSKEGNYVLKVYTTQRDYAYGNPNRIIPIRVLGENCNN